jgi:phosphatidylserine/phosphatidylglycerophosphate/cardiolipin synthase-like enzyme
MKRLACILALSLPFLACAAPAAPEQQKIESAFSPDGQAEALILRVIDTSRESVRLAAYSFTSPKVVRALMAAKRRGVDVRVVVDEGASKSKSGKAALNLVAGAGIPTRVNDRYAIMHDKFIVSDGRHVQTGSFNYSKAAAKSNSENVIVVRNNPKLANLYLQHWESRYGQGVDYRMPY